MENNLSSNDDNSSGILVSNLKNEKLEINTETNLQNLFNLLMSSYHFETNSSQYIMRLDKDTRQVKLVSKDELINGKVDLDEYTHPYFVNIEKKFKESQKNNQITEISTKILEFDESDKILLFSPHPDDEILGACGLLYKCFNKKLNINVVYMTSGKTAGDANVRKFEAINGIKQLGGLEDQLFFTSFPFYERKDRAVMDDDYDFAREIIRKYMPNKLFICADIFDPNRTHKKCFDILLKVSSEDEFKNIEIFFYYSVWYWPEEYEYTHILPYDYDTYKKKIYAMLEHRSQIETKFMGSDPRPFYQRATARDTSFGKLYNFDYCEVYFKLG